MEIRRPAPVTSAELDERISTPDEGVIASLRGCPGDFAVLGAGGKMGYHLCQMLVRALEALGRGDRVRAVSRFQSVRGRRDFESLGCEVIPADLCDREALEQLPDTPNVFFLAGVKFGTADDPGLLEKMNVTMPRLVAERFRESAIVALSTGCVYSFVSPESGGSTESDGTDPPGAYAQSCLGREQAFFDAARNFGTRSSLIRLNYANELRYGVLVDLAQKIIAGAPVDVTTGYVNVIWQGDALRHTIRSLEKAAAPPFVLNVTGPGVLPVRDLATRFGERLGRPVRFTGTEEPTAWLNDASRARTLFGEPEVSPDEMIEWIATWLEKGGEILGRPTHFETRDGNY